MVLLSRKRFVIGALIIILCLGLYSAQKYVRNLPIPFNQEKWLATKPPATEPARSGMAKDLIARKILIGKNRKDIETMLGPPENYPETAMTTMQYLLQEEYEWLGVDTTSAEHLVITFDQAGNVKNAEIQKWQR